MTLYLGLIGPEHIEYIRPLAEGEYETIEYAAKTLVNAVREHGLYDAVLANADAFGKAGLEHLTQHANEQPLDWEWIQDVTFDMNRHVLNFLTSFRAFLDHSETGLKRKYGEYSRQFVRFDTARKAEYDGNMSYRFVSKLRNYTQHCGMPIGQISVSSNVVGPHSKEITHSLVTLCKRDELLANYDGWGVPTRSMLEAQTPLFDIAPHLSEVVAAVRRIALIVYADDVPALVRSALYLQQLVSEVWREGYAPTLLAALIEGDEGTAAHVEPLPLRMVDKVLEAVLPGKHTPLYQRLRLSVGNIAMVHRTGD